MKSIKMKYIYLVSFIVLMISASACNPTNDDPGNPDVDIFVPAPNLDMIDFNGDGKSDITCYQPVGNWNTTPIAFSVGDGDWELSNMSTPNWANQPGVIAIHGEFNGDGKTDIAFHRPGSDWNTVPILFSNGDGTWNNFNMPAPTWANQPGVIAIHGEFNGDGKTDIAFHRPGSDWNTMPILFSNGNGTWNHADMEVPEWVNQSNVISIPGDYNRDGKTDIAFNRPGSSWTNVPVLLSNGDGSWTTQELTAPDWANELGVISIPDDFDGDGRTDIAFHKPAFFGWNDIKILFGADQKWDRKIGSLTIATGEYLTAMRWANSENATLISGDYNGDRKADLVLTIPDSRFEYMVTFTSKIEQVAPLNREAHSFLVEVTDFPTRHPLINRIGNKYIPGDFDGDTVDDIAFHNSPSSWQNIALLLSNGDGTWNNTNAGSFGPPPITGFTWMSQFTSTAIHNGSNYVRDPWNSYLRIQEAFLANDGSAYRNMIYDEHEELRLIDINEILGRLVQLLDFSKDNEIDGLEPMFIAYLDAVSMSGNNARRFAKDILNRYNFSTINSWPSYASPPKMNVLMPIGRLNSPIVFDMRADAVREILNGYKPIMSPNVNTPIPGMEDLVEDDDVFGQLCALSSLSDAGGTTLPNEASREDFCNEESGSAGNSGGANMIGNVSFGACLNLSQREATKFINTANCLANYSLATIGDNNPGPDIGMGIWSKAIPIIVDKAIDIILGIRGERDNASAELLESRRAVDAAQLEFDKAADEMNKAADDYAEAAEAYENGTGSEEDVEVAKENWKSKERIVRTAAKNLQNRKDEYLKQGGNIDSSTPDSPIKSTQELRNCICQGMNTEACNSIFPGSYVQQIIDGEIDPLEPYINPNPEAEPTEEEVFNSLFNLGVCGISFNDNRDGEECPDLIICEDQLSKSDELCTCNDIPTEEELAQAQEMSNNICQSLIRCADGYQPISGPFGCNCMPSGPEAGPVGPLPPVPIDILRDYYTVDGFYNAEMSSKSEAYLKHVFKTSNHLNQLIRY